MQQLNKVELKGIVGRIDIQTYADKRLARMSLLTERAYMKREGTAVIDVDWHTIVAWEGKDIQCLDAIAKGTKLHVLGRIRYQRYAGADGSERLCAEIVASRIGIIEDETLEIEQN